MKLDRTHLLIAILPSLVTAMVIWTPDSSVLAQQPVDSNVDAEPPAREVPAVVESMQSEAQQAPSVSAPVASSALPKAFVDRCLDVAEQIDPQFAQELRTLCELDSAEFERIIRRQGPRLTGLAELKLSDPILFDKKLTELKADAEVQKLSITLRRTIAQTPEDSARIRSLRAQLRGHLIIRLGFELDNQRLYIERIEKQLAALKKRMISDRENFNELVEQELARLSGTQDPVQAARD